MPADRPLLVDAAGRLLLDASGQLADPACCCGPPPECPELTLVCDSISASRYMCGDTFFYSEPARYYLQNVEVKTANFGDCDVTATRTITQIWDPSDVESGLCSHSYDVVYDPLLEELPEECGVDSQASYDSAFTGCTGDCLDYAISDEEAVCENKTCTLSDEYTPEQLHTDTVAGMPAYSGFDGDHSVSGQGTVCAAYRNFVAYPGEGYSPLSIRRFQHKFPLGASYSGYLKIFWSERFIPTLDEDVIFEGLDYYIGDPDPDPSHWTDTARTWTHVAGTAITESDVFEVLEPATNGTTSIVNIRWAVTEDCAPEIIEAEDPEDTCDPTKTDCTGQYNNCCQ